MRMELVLLNQHPRREAPYECSTQPNSPNTIPAPQQAPPVSSRPPAAWYVYRVPPHRRIVLPSSLELGRAPALSALRTAVVTPR